MKILTTAIVGLTVANGQSGLKGDSGTQKGSRSLYYEPPTTICKPDCSDSSKWRAVSWIGDSVCDDGIDNGDNEFGISPMNDLAIPFSPVVDLGEGK